MQVRGEPSAMGSALVCEVGPERYALPCEVIVEVAQVVRIHPLKGAPPIVEGILNYRGNVVPCIALQARFEESPSPLLLTDTLLIVRSAEDLVALRVPGTVEVLRVERARIVPLASLRSAAQRLAGVVALEDGMLWVCDVPALLDDAERRALRVALARHGDEHV